MNRVMIVPIPKMGPNGDRDTQRHPYFDYEVHMLHEDEEVGPLTLIHSVSGFDSFHSALKPKEQVRSEVQKYGERLATRFSLPLVWDGEGCQPWTVTMSVTVLARDGPHALELFERRQKEGSILPRAYQERTR